MINTPSFLELLPSGPCGIWRRCQLPAFVTCLAMATMGVAAGADETVAIFHVGNSLTTKPTGCTTLPKPAGTAPNLEGT